VLLSFDLIIGFTDYILTQGWDGGCRSVLGPLARCITKVLSLYHFRVIPLLSNASAPDVQQAPARAISTDSNHGLGVLLLLALGNPVIYHEEWNTMVPKK